MNLVILVEGDTNAPFSIATTPRWRGSTTYFPGLLHFTLDPHLIVQIGEQGGIKYHFWVFDMTRPRIESCSPGLLTNTLLFRPLPQSEYGCNDNRTKESIQKWFKKIQVLVKKEKHQVVADDSWHQKSFKYHYLSFTFSDKRLLNYHSHRLFI